MAQREAFLYLIYHQADGRSLLLFPNQAHPDNRIPARKAVTIPPPGEEFRFRVGPPFGTEVLQVLAALKPLEELDRLVKKTGQRAAGGAELIAQLQTRLMKDTKTWAEHRLPIRTLAGPRDALPQKAARVGLFIGIGKYLHPELAKTHEELGHSAEVMRDLMCKRGGLDPAKTRLVLNEKATKANLQELIARWLPGVSRPGDTVFLYFSGHVEQFDSADPARPNAKDAVLAPYDLSSGEGNLPASQRARLYFASAIYDSTLARWLQELQGRQLVLILDTCHGGGLPASSDLAKSFFLEQAEGIKSINRMNLVILTSCVADEQVPFERIRNKTMCFTDCLAEAVERDQTRPLTVPQAFQYARRRMPLLQKERARPPSQNRT